MRNEVKRWAAGGLAMAAGILFVASCDKDTPPPTVKAPDSVKPPTTAQLSAVVEPTGAVAKAEDLERVPALGTAVAWKAPDGKLWRRYPSGILMDDLLPGEGQNPKVGQSVKVKYIGTFPGSNKEFDRSKPDQPFEFVLGKVKGGGTVIKGWNMVVATMKVGGRKQVLIPPDLAYGERGHSPTIGPNQALIFEMELVGISGDPVELPAETESTTQSGIPAVDVLKSRTVGPAPATGK